MITRDNYEPYFVDYLEGNLPEDQIDQFLDFLNQNPDLKEELHLFEEVVLPEENIVFQDKQQLRKGQTDEKQLHENKVIAYLEGDMDIHESRAFGAYLNQHPELQKEYKQFEKTRLIPDLSIRYTAKNKLYHKPARTVVMNWVARAAAVVVLLWGINSLIQTPNKTEIVQNKFESAQTNSKESKVENQEKTEQQLIAQIQEKVKPSDVITPIKKKVEPKFVHEKTAEKQTLQPEKTGEDSILLAALPSIGARLENKEEMHLAVRQTNTIIRINEAPKTMSVDEFLAMRAKKVGKEGLFSAQRLARLGLNVASELSGERIGYKEKDGKITSVEFESKLMAFSIPLEKK